MYLLSTLTPVSPHDLMIAEKKSKSSLQQSQMQKQDTDGMTKWHEPFFSLPLSLSLYLPTVYLILVCSEACTLFHCTFLERRKKERKS